jgi:hypothetical protein
VCLFCTLLSYVETSVREKGRLCTGAEESLKGDVILMLLAQKKELIFKDWVRRALQKWERDLSLSWTRLRRVKIPKNVLDCKSPYSLRF